MSPVKSDDRWYREVPWKVLAMAAWAVTLILWAGLTTAEPLRRQMIVAMPIFSTLSFFALAVAVYFNVGTIKTALSPIPRRQWAMAAAIALMAFLFAHEVAPRTHRLYYDEDIYQDIAIGIIHSNKSGLVTNGNWHYGQFHATDVYNNKQGDAWPFLISVAFRIFGVGETVAANLANLLFPVAVMLLFICGWLLTGRTDIGLLAALVFSAIPENTRWFSTLAVEPPTATFVLLAVTCGLIAARAATGAAWFLAATSLGFAVQFRPEMVLLGILIAAVLWVECRERMREDTLHWALILMLYLLIGHLLHLYAVRGDPWGATTGDKFALKFFWNNVKTNSHYFFEWQRFPPYLSVLALSAFAFPGRWKIKGVTLLWFALAWSPFLFFYAGSYNYGQDVRFSVLAMAPLSLLAALAISQWWGLLPQGVADKGYFVLGTLLSLHLLVYLPLMRVVGEESWMSRADHDAARQFASLVPDEGIVLTYNPHMFHVWGKSAAQPGVFQEPNPAVPSPLRAKYNNQIYLYWDFWSNLAGATYSGLPSTMLANFHNQLIAEKTVRGVRYALYRLLDRRPAPVFGPTPKPGTNP